MAAPIQIFELTNSTLMVGLLGLAQFPALFLGSFLGGVLADSRDRRNLYLMSQVILAIFTVGLAVNASVDNPSIALVYVLTAANAFMSGIDSPARSAAIPRIVSAANLPSALALQVLMMQTAGAVGPAIAGVAISQLGLAAVYWLDVATFVAAIVTALAMAPLPPASGTKGAGLKSMVDGIRFLRSRESLKGVFLIDINAMVFGMPRALFPEFGLGVLGGTEATVGYLYAAPGVGAMAAALTSGWVARVRRLGRATTFAVMAWGLGIAGFGLSRWLWLGLICLALAGAGDAISAVFRSTILQLTTPDHLRGRLSAVQIAVVAGGPRLGDAEAGIVATGFGPRVAAWSGGLAATAGAFVIAQMFPRFRDWTRRDSDANDP